MTAQFARAPHVSGRPTTPVYNAPHAALLIDFDNVTMGIRSDLTKELKSLLNSDIIKGKVAVQRAYADWRRYPQYIVPLAEASVDLIFAPAYGSSKKNATDIRLSIDALELVFTRPEIGTFILLSGDSDFSSLVLKLKEYGKYVIGVGIRESASDLLVQNCDEYYSYSALTGLTRTGDEELKAWDPWELVEISVQRMADQNDVMRSDRLKQVILELDPNFDEKALGFTKFNRFLQEAHNRGLISLRKLENGQFEVAPAADEVETEAAPVEQMIEEAPRRSRRERRGEEAEARGGEEATDDRPPSPEAPPARAATSTSSRNAATAPTDLPGAYALLRQATGDLGGRARDSDVKRRILELRPEWTESPLGFSKFSRFLRQAHDDQIINLHKLENGNYEIALGEARAAAPAPEIEVEAEAAPARSRRRRGGRSRDKEGERERPRDGERQRSARSAEADRTREQKPARGEQDVAPQTPAIAARQSAQSPPPGAPPVSLLFRRGSRRGQVPRALPPLLEGQTYGARAASVSAQPAAAPPAATPSRESVADQFDLPRDEAGVVNRLLRYKGVGRKTAEAAVQAFGAGAIFDVLHSEPDRVRAELGARRAQPLLEGWAAQLEELRRNGAEPPHANDASKQTGRRVRKGARAQRGRRGGRGRSKSITPRE